MPVVHSREEVEMVIREGKRMISSATALLRSCQDGTDASMCWGIMLEYNNN
jgi:hypothetical protein